MLDWGSPLFCCIKGELFRVIFLYSNCLIIHFEKLKVEVRQLTISVVKLFELIVTETLAYAFHGMSLLSFNWPLSPHFNGKIVVIGYTLDFKTIVMPNQSG